MKHFFDSIVTLPHATFFSRKLNYRKTEKKFNYIASSILEILKQETKS